MSKMTALTGSMLDFRQLKGSDILNRVDSFFEWQELRRKHGLWVLGRSTERGPLNFCEIRSDRGELHSGVNFASQDYLNLSRHPDVLTEAKSVIDDYGVHSAGSSALLGNTTLSLLLEKQIADFIQMEFVTLYPTGWAAGFGAIKGLVHEKDYIVMDQLAHACLQEGAHAATRNIIKFKHNNIEHLEKILKTLRQSDSQTAILVVTEALFSMDSDTPDLKEMQRICSENSATLLVDVAHDLGNLGTEGTGHLGMQGMLGKVDIVMGSFSKTFASNGGFVAVKQRKVKEYLGFYSSPNTFSNALSPIQAAIISKSLAIVRSPQGGELRSQLMKNIQEMRHQLSCLNLQVFGSPSAIICANIGNEKLTRLTSHHLPLEGLIVNMVEFPAVAKGKARFRFQMMANHSVEQISKAVSALESSLIKASREVDELASSA